jgi:putative sterol carrier protein
MANQDMDITQVTPEEFAALVAGASDQQIAEVIHSVGTKQVLDRVFNGMGERFLPEKAEGVNATVQFTITDEGAEYPYSIAIADGKAAVSEGPADSPKVNITTDVVSFANMIAGQAEGTQLFMTGKLRAAGDLMFATRLMTFFDRPKPQS